MDDYEISEYMFKLTLPTSFSSKIFFNSKLSNLESILNFLFTKNVLNITFFFDIQSCLINLEWLFCEILKLKLFKTIQTLAHLHTNIRYFSRSSPAPFSEEQEMKIRNEKQCEPFFCSRVQTTQWTMNNRNYKSWIDCLLSNFWSLRKMLCLV